MSLCVTLHNGQLTPTGEAPASCSAFLLMDKADYEASVVVGSLWDFDPVVAGQFFGFSIGLVLTCYLTAWAAAQVLSQIQRR